jgi:hypothetical protein
LAKNITKFDQTIDVYDNWITKSIVHTTHFSKIRVLVSITK